jgi:hypothetical protein
LGEATLRPSRNISGCLPNSEASVGRRYVRRNLPWCIKIVKWFYSSPAFFDERWPIEFRQACVRVRDGRGFDAEKQFGTVSMAKLSCLGFDSASYIPGSSGSVPL